MNSKNDYSIQKKSQLRRVDISAFDTELPDLKNKNSTKTFIIGNWLSEVITSGLKSGKFAVNDVIPGKAEFAYRFGVSTGTIQNAFRYAEDLGFIESKQCIGTLIKDHTEKKQSMRKQVSRRDVSIETLKRYIISNNLTAGSCLPPSKELAELTGYSVNTMRFALGTLSLEGILKRVGKSNKLSKWVVQHTEFEVPEEKHENSTTLVDMVIKDMENYIVQNLKIGDKIPSHLQLSKTLNASLKTIHDALKILINDGILLPRRGKYGTIVIRIPGTQNHDLGKESSIFAPAPDAAFYYWEKTKEQIKRMIANEYEIGDKLPTINELAQRLELSSNTIRKAYQKLASEGYLVFSRGRYGGTFVIDIPEIEAASFKWIAVNPEYVDSRLETTSENSSN